MANSGRLCSEHLRIRGNKTKYVFAVLMFAALTGFAVSYSLAPWFEQHHRRAAEQYRISAYRAAIDGSAAQSEAFYRAALMEAEQLKNSKLVAEIKTERDEVQQQQSARAAKSKSGRDANREALWIWPGLTEVQDLIARKRRYSQTWSPMFEVVMRRERTLSSSAMRSIDLGDLQMELFNFPFAIGLYQTALKQAETEHNDSAKVIALDRLAQISFVQGRFDSSLKLLANALDVARKSGDQKLSAVVLTHQGQVLCEVGRPSEGLECSGEAMKLINETESPFKQYAELVSAACMSYAGSHAEALYLLRQIQNKDGGTEPASAHIDSARLVRLFAEALVNAGRISEADRYFYALADFDKPEKKKDSLAYEQRFMTEAQRYGAFGKHKTEIALCDLALKSREARIGKRKRGLINVLQLQANAFSAAGEHAKAVAAKQRIQDLAKEFGYPPVRQRGDAFAH